MAHYVFADAGCNQYRIDERLCMETKEASANEKPATLRDIASLPGPRGIPILGNALQIETARLHQQIEGWAHKYGLFYRLHLGKRNILVVADHEAIATMLRDRPDGRVIRHRCSPDARPIAWSLIERQIDANETEARI